MSPPAGGEVTVLHVVDHFSDAGGAEVSLVQMLPWLQREGIRNALLPMHGERTSAAAPALAAAGVRLFPPAGPGVRSRVAAAVRAARELDADLLHSTMWDADLAARLAGARTGTPVVAGLINTPYSAEARARAVNPRALEVYRRVDGLLARHATFRFHALTESVAAEAVRSLGIRPERVTVIPRGRDRAVLGEPTQQRRLAVRRGLGLGADVPVVVNVARQEPQKAIPELLRAFAVVLAAHPEAVLLQAGRPGSATAETEATAAELGLRPAVRFLGRRSDVADLLAAADVFATTSHWEGQGGAVLEAMAMRLPVAAYDLAPFVESTAGTAVLVPIGDTGGLGTAIDRLLGDPTHARRLAEAARARFDTTFEMGGVAARMAGFYRDTVAAAGRRRGRRATRARTA